MSDKPRTQDQSVVQQDANDGSRDKPCDIPQSGAVQPSYAELLSTVQYLLEYTEIVDEPIANVVSAACREVLEGVCDETPRESMDETNSTLG